MDSSVETKVEVTDIECQQEITSSIANITQELTKSKPGEITASNSNELLMGPPQNLQFGADNSAEKVVVQPDCGANLMTDSTSPECTAALVSSSPHTPRSLPSNSSPIQQVPEGTQTVTHVGQTFSTGCTLPPGLLHQSRLDALKNEQPLPPGVPPKKPLTPYMRFSKTIWQSVKAANQSLSVCEIGAMIGRMWRELNEADKTQYNEDFVVDKARYDEQLQTYLKATGLQASDLVKPKARKKDSKDRPQGIFRKQHQGVSTVNQDTSQYGTQTEQIGYIEHAVGGAINGSANQLQAGSFQVSGGSEMSGGTLPHFSQVWSGQDIYNQQLLAQMGLTAEQFASQTTTIDSTGALLTIEPQQLLETDNRIQMAALFSDPSSQQHQGASVQQQLASSTDLASQAASGTDSWLWQQYAAANQYTSAAAANGTPVQSHDGVIIYQLTPNGTHEIIESKSNNIKEEHLEPGEVPPNGPTVTSDGTIDASIYQVNPAYASYALSQWNHFPNIKSDKSEAHTDVEKQLLRSALQEKSRELLRLTRELEQAYGLIHQLKQQNEFYQRQWTTQTNGTLDGSGSG